jgi:hypothetical protein
VHVSVNQGSGPAADAIEQNAVDNIKAFVADLRERGLSINGFERAPDADYGDGRFAFHVHSADGTRREVQMPGLPLEQVRWLKSEGQSIREFPRLYIDGSSWVWYFALDRFEKKGTPLRWPDGTVKGGAWIVFPDGAGASR